jgi:hypothetical protein
MPTHRIDLGRSPKQADMLLEGWMIGCMAFKALLCSGDASSPEQRSALRAIDPSPPHKNHIRLLGGSSLINPTCRRGTQGLLWASRGLFLSTAAMVRLVVVLGTAVPSPPNHVPPQQKKTKIFQSQPPGTLNGCPDFGHGLVFILCGTERKKNIASQYKSYGIVGFVLFPTYTMGLAGVIYGQWRIGNKKFFTTEVLLTLQYSTCEPTTHNKQHTTTKMDHCHPTLQQL